MEFVVHLALASDRKAYLRDPWRILDLGILLISLLSLLPMLRALRSTPVLRLLRLSRAFLVGARFGGRALHRSRARPEEAEAGPSEITALRDGGQPEPLTMDRALEEAASSRDVWLHFSRVDRGRIEEIARAAKLPARFLQSNLDEATRPRVEVFESFSALFLWLPDVPAQGPVRLERTTVLLVTTKRALLSLSSKPFDAQARVAEASATLNLPEEAPVGTRRTYAFLRVLLEKYREVVRRLEDEVRRLEEVPAKGGGPSFFEDSFALERELTAARGDLWRLKGVLASMSEGRVNVHGARREDREFLRSVAEEAESLHETSSTLRESLVSLMDLHMNVASFEMNKGMRMLAILSAVALIPAVVGGLLGMNLVGNPWPATLPQVAFGVLWGMAVAVYLFFVKGWIR